MKAELLSVDFIHEDCDDAQMVIHFRTAKGGVVGGEWEIYCPALEPNLKSTLRAMTNELTGTDDESIQKGLFDLAGHKPSHYCACLRRSLLTLIRNAANRTWPSDRDITFAAALLGIESVEIGEK